MWFPASLYLIFLSWLLGGVGNKYVRLTHRLVMHSTHFSWFVGGYTFAFAYILHARWLWSTQLLLLTAPWYLLFVFYHPCEIFYLRCVSRIPTLSSMRWRSTDPEVLSQSSKTFVLSVYADPTCQRHPIGTLMVTNTRLLTMGYALVEQCTRLHRYHSSINTSNDFLETCTVFSTPLVRYREEIELNLGRLPVIRDAHIQSGTGSYADVGGRIELRDRTLTVWME